MCDCGLPSWLPRLPHYMQLVLNVNIRTGLVLTEITNPPAVTGYRVRIYSGPTTNSLLVKMVQFTVEQAAAVQKLNLATLGLPAGTYSVGIIPVGEHGTGPESPRSNYVAVQARRSAGTRATRPGRLLAEVRDAVGQPKQTSTFADGDDALHKRHRNRHLL